MSLLSNTQMTIYEAQLREGFADKDSFLVDFIYQNEFMNYASWIPASDGNVHRWTKATKLGEGAWSKINDGITAINSKADQFIVNLKMFEAESLCDERILMTAKSPMNVRNSEDIANMEGFSLSLLYNILYNTNTTDGVLGLLQRRNAIGAYCIDASQNASNGHATSLLLMETGGKGLNFIYQSGMPSGITTKDRGLQRVPAPSGTGSINAWVRSYMAHYGMMIKNDHAVQRLANLNANGSAFPLAKFVSMKNNLPSSGKSAVAFVNRNIKSLIEMECLNKSNMAYQIGSIEGFGPVNKILGIPIAMCEAILETENTIS